MEDIENVDDVYSMAARISELDERVRAMARDMVRLRQAIEDLELAALKERPTTFGSRTNPWPKR